MTPLKKPPLVALTDPNEDVRRDAAEAFGQHRESAAVVPLMLVLERDPDWQVRQAAAVALGYIGDIQALPVLERVIGSVDMSTAEEKIAYAADWAITHITNGSK